MGIFFIIGIASIIMGILSLSSDFYGSLGYILAGFFLALVENIGVNNLIVFDVNEVSLVKVVLAWLSFIGFILLLCFKTVNNMYR